MSRLPATLAYGLIRRGCSPANLANARYAMAAWRAWPTADGGRLAQQTKASGPAIDGEVVKFYRLHLGALRLEKKWGGGWIG